MKLISKLFIFAAIIALSCSEEKIIVGTETLSYFPLEVGYQWEYEPMRTDSFGTRAATFTVVSQETRLGLPFFAMERRFENHNGQVSSDTIYYRVDEQGFVFETSRYNQGQINRFKLGAKEGDQWEMGSWTEEKYKVTTSITDVSLAIGVLKNCKSFSYDIAQWMDEEHYFILAEGIGIVQYGNAWGFDFKLKSAQLGAVSK